jgi:hypothetical protein
LTGPTRRRTWATARANGAGRWQAGTNTDGARSGWGLTRGMHGPTLARTQRRTWRANTGSLWAWALKNRLAWYGTSRRGTGSNRRSRLRNRNGRSRRSFVYGTRPGLRHDHPRRRSLRYRRSRRRRRTMRRPGRGSLRSRGYCCRRRSGRSRRNDGRRNRYGTGWCNNRWRARNRSGGLLRNRRRCHHRPRSDWRGWRRNR